jgi:uncharacterized protein (DUF302 family)
MKSKHNFLFLFVLMFLFVNVNASDFGVYEKVVEKAKASPDELAGAIASGIESSGFTFLNKIELHTPNLIRQDTSRHSSYQAFVVLATSTKFDSLLLSFANRYAANWILRIGIYQDENGTHVSITNPETMTRIICNDLNEKDYQIVIEAAQQVKQDLRKVILAVVKGTEVSKQMPPIRNEARIRKAKKDMMMMVGPMTFFKNPNQFPILKETATGENAQAVFEKVLSEIEQNIDQFIPSEKENNYHWTTNPDSDLKWRVACKVKLAGANAAVLGITRNRTEALSFHICGMKREKNINPIPGIDHLTSYPIEVVIFEENGKIKVGTPREMFRMDMFFWDAGKMAFMKYMNMPKMLDKSIKKAITGQ